MVVLSRSVEADKEATVEAVLENAYPPLRLRMQDNVTLPLDTGWTKGCNQAPSGNWAQAKRRPTRRSQACYPLAHARCSILISPLSPCFSSEGAR